VTPKEASAAFRKLQREIGPKFNVHINLETDGDAPLSGWASSGDGHWRKVMDVHADDFATLIDRMRATWAEIQATERANRVKEMALAVISATDEDGRCSESALRLARFTAAEIAELGEEATTKANEMAGRGPFSIERSANSNAPVAA
jgi:hypothetical protein